MTFPTTPLEVRIDLLVDGAWTNVTSDVLVEDSITITRGRADEASRADPSTCALTFENRDGRYSPRNPTSPYYGKLGRNTPLRVGVGSPPIAASQDSAAASVSLVAPSVTAEASGLLSVVWGAKPVGNVTLPGGFSAGLEVDGTASTWGSAYKSVAAGATGTATATHSVSAATQACGAVTIPGATLVSSTTQCVNGVTVSAAATGLTGRYLLVWHGWSEDPDDEMTRVPFDTAPTSPGWMLLTDTGPSTGPRLQAWIRRCSEDAATVYVQARPSTDNYMRFQVLSGVTEFHPRFIGEVSQWPSRWDLSGVDVRAPVVASGIRRRLSQGASPLRSALRREFDSAAGVVGYWPMEDADGSAAFASAVGGKAARFLGAPVLAAAVDGLACTDPLPTFQAAGAIGILPGATAGEWVAGALFDIPAGVTNDTDLLTISTTGTIASWTLKVDTGAPGIHLSCFQKDTGATIADLHISMTVSPVGGRFFLSLDTTTSGADVPFRMLYIPIISGQTPSAEAYNNTVPGFTCGRVTSVQLLGGGVPAVAGTSAGHLVVATGASALFTFDAMSALRAWEGESATSRFLRLCRENVAPAYCQIFAVSEALGSQRSATLLDLLDQGTDSDNGMMLDARGFIGLTYRPRTSLVNQDARLALTYTTPGHIAEPFEPTDDDQGTVNDVTVARIGGSTARAVLESGPLSVAAPPAGVGRYETRLDLSLFSDDRLDDQAGWRLHRGTWNEARWPRITTRLSKVVALIPTVAMLEAGDLVTLAGLPSWVPPGPVELVLEGYTEVLAPYAWDWTGNFSPGGPWRVLEADSADYGRADSETSTLSAGVTSTATSLSVAVEAGSALWITTATVPGDFPFDAVVGGEIVTVTAISGTTSPQTWTVTRSINGVVKAQTAGTQIRLAHPSVVAL